MDSFKLPLKLTCRISGKVVTYTSDEYVRKKLEKYGGNLKAMLDDFVCRDAKRLLKASDTTPKEKKPQVDVIETTDTDSDTDDDSDIEVQVGVRDFANDESILIPSICINPVWYRTKENCNHCACSSRCKALMSSVKI